MAKNTKTYTENGYRMLRGGRKSYLAYPKCRVYMPDFRLETLAGQGNAYFEILFSLSQGLGFVDISSGIHFYIGYPSIIELRKFLETMGMELVPDEPFPEDYQKQVNELNDLRADMIKGAESRLDEYESQRNDRKNVRKSLMTYVTIMRGKGLYDENNSALREAAAKLNKNSR